MLGWGPCEPLGYNWAPSSKPGEVLNGLCRGFAGINAWIKAAGEEKEQGNSWVE